MERPELETQKRIIPIFTILAIVGIGATIYFFYQNMNYKKDLREKNTQIAQQRNVLSEQKQYTDSIQTSLEMIVADLETKNDSLVDQINKLNTPTISENTPKKDHTKRKTDRLLSKSEKSKYIIGAYTHDDTKLLYTMGKALRANGYYLNDKYNYSKIRPLWSSRRGAIVYYYDPAARSHAQDIADILTKYTKEKYRVIQLNSRKGTISGQERWTLFIHSDGNARSKKELFFP